MSAWDLTALVNAANARAGQADRHLWLVRLMEWLRHAPRGSVAAVPDEARTPLPVLRLRHLLNQIEKNDALRAEVQGMMRAFWHEIDAASLYADFGFGSRVSLTSEWLARVQARLLPGTPETRDLAALFRLLFEPGDADWIEAVDAETLHRATTMLMPDTQDWRTALLDAITILVSAVHAAGYTPAIRQRMDAEMLRDEPFRQLPASAGELRSAVLEGRHAEALRAAAYLRAVLDACRRAAASVKLHLEQFGVSVDIVFGLDQLRGRARRIEQLLEFVLVPDSAPQGRRLLVELVRAITEERGVGKMLERHYSLLARQVTERSAETGEHYITRTRDEYRDMLRRAAGGGLVIAGTTFVKFAIAAIGLSAFWGGFWAGANYAASFVIVMLLHWTVATKQPAMTAPALAASLPATGGTASDEQIETFVDRVAQLIRSQSAGIVGNVALCAPLVWAAQWLATTLFGAPLVGTETAGYVLQSLTLLGPTALFAAFTGVLLFASSLIAGWAENWFVLHRLDSAIAWNPRIVAALGGARARRWSSWARANVSGLAANISLGMMLGLVPALLNFLGPPLEVRHVTLSAGQLGAALGALGTSLFSQSVFWWCLAGIAVTGVLNVAVSFGLAFKVALRSRGVRLRDRSRIAAALRRRLLTQPLSFLWPPRD